MRIPASSVVGLVCVALASVVMSGWVLREPDIVWSAAGAPMVFSAALGVALIGAAVAAEGWLADAAARRVRIALGGAAALLGAAALASHFAGRDVGIDWPNLHRWLPDSGLPPGRMSLPAAVAFLLAGAALALLDRAHRVWQGIAVQGLTAAVFVLGAIGVIARILQLELVFAENAFAQMALQTGIGLVACAGALWLAWRRMPWYRNRRLVRREDDRIALAGGTVLALVVCATVTATLAASIAQLQDSARISLMEQLKGRIDHFRANLELRSGRPAIIGTRPSVIAALAALSANPNDSRTRMQLEQDARTLLPLGYSGAAFHGIDGRVYASAGEFVAHAAFFAPLSTAYPSTLYWDRGFVLRSQLAVQGDGRVIGVLVTDQPLPALTAAFTGTNDFARSAELRLCARAGDGARCVRERETTSVETLTRDSAIPVAQALAKGLAVSVIRGDGGRFLIAAHGPVGTTGLGAMLTLETAELYAPVRAQLEAAALVMALMAVTGAWLLRLRVAPLVRRLAASEERLSLALDGSRLALWDYDVAARSVHLDARWREMLGGRAEPSAVAAEDLMQLVHPEDVAMLTQHLAAVLAGTATHYDIEHRVRRDDDGWLWIRSRGRVVAREPGGGALRLAGTNADIDRRKRAELELAHRAGHDALTGLPNRALFEDRLGRAIARSRRARVLMAVMYLDIDRFKGVNDAFGHDVGDALIREFAARLAACVRDTDTAARLGGDEFAVILEALESIDAGTRIAEKIVVAMRAAFALDGRRLEVSASVGIAFYLGEAGVAADGLLKRADEALYRAKAAGRNTYRVSGDTAPAAAPA